MFNKNKKINNNIGKNWVLEKNEEHPNDFLSNKVGN